MSDHEHLAMHREREADRGRRQSAQRPPAASPSDEAPPGPVLRRLRQAGLRAVRRLLQRAWRRAAQRPDDARPADGCLDPELDCA